MWFNLPKDLQNLDTVVDMIDSLEYQKMKIDLQLKALKRCKVLLEKS